MSPNPCEHLLFSMFVYSHPSRCEGVSHYVVFFFFSLFIFDTEGTHVSGGGAERGADREPQAGSALSIQSSMQDSISQTVRS